VSTWKDVFANQPDNTAGALAIFERDPKITGPEPANRTTARAVWGGRRIRSTGRRRH
jgi:hypothetical protein